MKLTSNIKTSCTDKKMIKSIEKYRVRVPSLQLARLKLFGTLLISAIQNANTAMKMLAAKIVQNYPQMKRNKC